MGRAEGVLDELFDKNFAWADRKTAEDPTFFRRLAEQQAPRFLWLGCSDSRVPANDVVGLDPGEIFVHRNIANVVHSSDMNMLAVLEFAVDVLRVRHIIVCGHYGCGGVRRALENADGTGGSGLVDHWLAPVVDLYARHRATIDASAANRLDRLCELNVEIQVRRLAATPVLKSAWARGTEVTVHGWIYGIGDGLLRDLGTTVSSPAEFAALPSLDTLLAAPVEPMTAARRHAIAAFLEMDLEDVAPCGAGCTCGAFGPATAAARSLAPRQETP
ncbi:carbonic anhydrase [Xanthobacter dioxanivorans]|uniref:Carbonic anhydrase n=1 Tax=Xanthobacter dioxanivorans TaxID=2528964 RepID=A0A974PN15_9HYPH|nr:carbonic anhydrase [Xanthobacter dioxanivorans]QRG06303.1 carbonic anhydrase [Xanthobacter dioxanivorans]